jgi:ABC-2 type transport system permease protein
VRRLLAIIDKEWAETVRNRLLLITVFVMPTLFLVLPLVILYVMENGPPVDESEVRRYAELAPQFAGLEARAVMQIVIANQFLFFFLMLPSFIPMTVASFSIIGEKQARSLEPLLATPVSTEEILLGKIVAAVTPAIVTTWVAYGVFVVGSYLIVSPPVWQAIVKPMWLLAMLVIGPLVAGLSVIVGVMVSSRVNDTRIAQQVGAIFILPIAGAAIAQTAGAIFYSAQTFVVAALVIAGLDVAAFVAGVRLFQRDKILTQWK